MIGMNYLIKAIIWMIKIVTWTAPLGVLGLMASSIGAFGFDLLTMILDLVWIYLLDGAFILLIL